MDVPERTPVTPEPERPSPTPAPAPALAPAGPTSTSTFQFRYCPSCAAGLQPQALPDGQQVLHCPACGYVHYRNSRPTAGAVVVRDGRALFGRRRSAPHAGKWDILGGFLHHGEHPEDGLRREVREEIGLDVRILRLLGFYMDDYHDDADTVTGADAATGTGTHAPVNDDAILNIYYLAQAAPGEPQANDDVSELAWFTPDALPADDDWAFAHQPAVIRDWLALAGLSMPFNPAGSARHPRRRARDLHLPLVDPVAVPPSAADALAGLAVRAPRTEWHTSIASTMDRARELAQADDTVDAVVADYQEAGRGTQGRTWHAPSGTCLMSTFIGHPTTALDASALTEVPLRIANSVATWLQAAYGVRAEVKPPNDVMVDGRKLCGILCQSQVIGDRVLWLLCGIGLNTHMRAGQLPLERATSLALELGPDAVPAHARLLQDLYTELTRTLPEIFPFTPFDPVAASPASPASGYRID